jgi:hypothetical protein
MPEGFNCRIFTVVINNFKTVIGRTVIDNNNFFLVRNLGINNCRQLATYRFSFIVTGDDD